MQFFINKSIDSTVFVFVSLLVFAVFGSALFQFLYLVPLFLLLLGFGVKFVNNFSIFVDDAGLFGEIGSWSYRSGRSIQIGVAD